MVALFRTTHDLWAGDPAFVDLLDRLRRDSPEFAGWWKRHDIRDVASGQKPMVHPTKGVLRFQHASFQSNDEPGLKLVIYTPVPYPECATVFRLGGADLHSQDGARSWQ